MIFPPVVIGHNPTPSPPPPHAILVGTWGKHVSPRDLRRLCRRRYRIQLVQVDVIFKPCYRVAIFIDLTFFKRLGLFVHFWYVL